MAVDARITGRTVTLRARVAAATRTQPPIGAQGAGTDADLVFTEQTVTTIVVSRSALDTRAAVRIAHQTSPAFALFASATGVVLADRTVTDAQGGVRRRAFDATIVRRARWQLPVADPRIRAGALHTTSVHTDALAGAVADELTAPDALDAIAKGCITRAVIVGLARLTGDPLILPHSVLAKLSFPQLGALGNEATTTPFDTRASPSRGANGLRPRATLTLPSAPLAHVIAGRT